MKDNPQSPTQRNVEAIAELERQDRSQKSLSEKLSARIMRAVGRLSFVLVNLGVIAAWCLVNVGAVPILPRFDPFPFGTLTLLISIEAMLLAVFLLINQNQMRRQQELRSHLNLQIALLGERETTRILQLTRAMARKQGISAEPEDEQLVEKTEIYGIAAEVRHHLRPQN